ncbi:MAG: ABC transporter substrate-binding protein [Proteobacteria bacterium]|nr:ABC transporter substrate-binding protein [Pseudomonadota bacterium]
MNSILFSLFLSISLLISPSLFAESFKKVLISQVAEHPALNSTIEGILDALKEEGYIPEKNLKVRVESAQANAALASQIAQKFVNQAPDIVVGVGTLSAQSFAKYAQEGKVTLVFSSVTDPLQAGLVKTLQNPSNNTSGVSNFVKLEPQLELFKALQPSLKTLGILYNPGEINSVSIVQQLEKLCPQFGIKLLKQTASKTADVYQSALKLAQTVDALFISNDSTALSAFQSVVKAAESTEIPIYVSDTDIVQFGAVAALGPNQYEVGKQTGFLIAHGLRGASMGDQAVEFPSKTDLVFNLEAAAKAHIKIEKSLLTRAAKIISSSERS